MFIATGTNNDLRKLRQERHVIEPDRMDWLVGVAGGNRPGPQPIPLLAELGVRVGAGGYRHVAPSGAWDACWSRGL